MDMSMGNNNQKQTTTYDQNRPKYNMMINGRFTASISTISETNRSEVQTLALSAIAFTL